MSYYDSKFYQRWFTMNTLSPAERRWWIFGMIEGIIVAAVLSHFVRDAIFAMCQSTLLSCIVGFAFWLCCAFVFSEAARAIGRQREAARHTQQSSNR
jgi:hypothetical protein